MSWEENKCYEFEFADGTNRRLKFEGFGEYMKKVWRDVDTGEVISDLPPYKTYTEVKCK